MIEGPIFGHSDSPASIYLRAADSVTVRGSVDLSTGDNYANGGWLDIYATNGDATLAAKVRGQGGGLGGGGYVTLDAGQDASITAPVYHPLFRV